MTRSEAITGSGRSVAATGSPVVHLLSGALKNYDWGSRETIARLTGRACPSASPEAELWFGAHPQGPARLPARDTDLAALIAQDPQTVLGAGVAERFGSRLPYLLKVLAPARALSIQAHPNERRAQVAPEGTYVDGWPKPEGVLALTEFEIFAGLLGVEDSLDLARRSGADRLATLIESMPGTDAFAEAEADNAAARQLLHRLLHLAADECADLVRDTVGAARTHREQHPQLDAVARIAEQFPGDPGLLVLMTMRHRVLAPGEFVFVPAGVLHAYVRGAGVEVMASSDNVVRAGLTPKRIDVDELERIVDVALQIEPETPTVHQGWSTFAAPTPYFRLHTADAGTAVGDPGVGHPRILLALEGEATATCGEVTIPLRSGEAVFVGVDEPPISLTGSAHVFLVTPGI